MVYNATLGFLLLMAVNGLIPEMTPWLFSLSIFVRRPVLCVLLSSLTVPWNSPQAFLLLLFQYLLLDSCVPSDWNLFFSHFSL